MEGGLGSRGAGRAQHPARQVAVRWWGDGPPHPVPARAPGRPGPQACVVKRWPAPLRREGGGGAGRVGRLTAAAGRRGGAQGRIPARRCSRSGRRPRRGGSGGPPAPPSLRVCCSWRGVWGGAGRCKGHGPLFQLCFTSRCCWRRASFTHLQGPFTPTHSSQGRSRSTLPAEDWLKWTGTGRDRR